MQIHNQFMHAGLLFLEDQSRYLIYAFLSHYYKRNMDGQSLITVANVRRSRIMKLLWPSMCAQH